jgi:hypothetical protein
LTDERGLPLGYTIVPANEKEYEPLADLLTGTSAEVVIADKGLWGRGYQTRLAADQIRLFTPDRTRTAANIGRERALASLRLGIESVFSNLKGQMRLERRVAKTPAGLALRIAQRILALIIGVLLNTLAARHAPSPPTAAAKSHQASSCRFAVGPHRRTDAYLVVVQPRSRHLRKRGQRSAAVLAIGAAALFMGAAITETRSDHLSSSSRQICIWRATPSADPHPLLYDRFDSVAAVSPREAWAVGDYFTAHEGGTQGAFIERWNGQRWRVVAAPIPRGAILWSVSASGTREVWAVGQADDGGQLIEHWDGMRWRVVAPPPHHGGILFAVAARAPRDAWAVGVRSLGGGGKTLTEHWDGTRWTVVQSPSPGAPPGHRRYAILRAVTAISPADVWAAGYSGGVRSPVTRTLIEHWDGRRWTIVPSPNVHSNSGVTNDILFSLSGSRPDDVWAVGSLGSVPSGYGGKGDHTLALHWDGRRWSHIATPAVRQRALLFGVVARAGRAWAVGDHGLQPHQQTLIERFDGTRWSVVPSPSGFSLAAVSAHSGGAVLAVGANGRQPLAAQC